MACERCINAPPGTIRRQMRERKRPGIARACDLMVPKHAYEILQFREFFHFRAGVATPPSRLPVSSEGCVNTAITDCSRFVKFLTKQLFKKTENSLLRPAAIIDLDLFPVPVTPEFTLQLHVNARTENKREDIPFYPSDSVCFFCPRVNLTCESASRV